MRREGRGNPGDAERALRLLALKSTIQFVTMGAIVVFIVLSFVVPQNVGRLLLPLVLLSLAAYTAASGFVAFEVGITGIGPVDSRQSWARGIGVLWIFAACFLALFALTYFFN
ncbi:MAG: hypothetical protein ACYC3S_06410 [Chloroflexota bacterium]